MLCASSALRGPTVTVLARASVAEHVQRLGRADAQTVALADGVGVRAAMLAEHGAGVVDDRAGQLAEAAVALEEVAVARAGEEAQILRVGLARDGQAGIARQLAHLLLVHARRAGSACARSDCGESADST